MSVDMEGISGVSSLKQIRADTPEYAMARIWMTEDVNAAVEGAVSAGASEILVRDAHGRATNIPPDRLHPKARLMAGWMPNMDMLQGLDSTWDVVFMIGYHPGPPSKGGVLSHTYHMSAIREVVINGISAGETLLNAIQAGMLGVPVGLVTGERALHDEIAGPLGSAEFVPTKTGFGYQSALLEPVAVCREEIRRCAARAVERAGAGRDLTPYIPEAPISLRVDFQSAEACETARLIPGFRAASTRTMEMQAASADELLRSFQLLMQVLYGMNG